MNFKNEHDESTEVFEKIKHCIPAYFKVTIKTKQE